MAYLTFVDQPRRQFCTHQLVELRMVEIASAYKRWRSKYRASDPDRTDPNGDRYSGVREWYLHQAQTVAADMHTFGLIPTETLNDPYFDLWTFGCDLFDWWCIERDW